ncbi:MAG: flippase [Candidatus Omnitrophota bacterium]
MNDTLEKTEKWGIPTLDNALKHITKSGFFIFFGSAVGGVIGFLTRILVIKNISESEFGVLSIALVFLSLIVWLFAAGLVVGLSRLISYYKSRNNLVKVETIVRTAVWSSLCMGIGISVILLFIGSKIFHLFYSANLFPVFAILVGGVPFLIFTALCIQIFLGFGVSAPKIYLDPASSSAIRLATVLIAIFFSNIFAKAIFLNIIWAYFFSFLITGLIALFYTAKNLPQFIKFKLIGNMDKEIILFSLPLLGAVIFSFTLGWTDTLFIGYFYSPTEVGIYNVAFTLANIIPFLLLVPIGYIYTPIATQYYAGNMLAKVKDLYSSLSRWIFVFTIIPTFVFLLFPKQVLILFFGERYINASFALTLLTGGFLVQIIFGPIVATLIALGKNKTILSANFIGLAANISLNFFLVPKLGIIGASYACLFSIILVNVAYFLPLYYKDKISPFNKDYLKVILLGTISILLVYIPGKFLLNISTWMLPAVILIFLLILGILFFLTDSITENDKMLWEAIVQRFKGD